jgi:class 3 adenylate cyclase/tetratricopeptide (TPR) repeat protein
MFEKPIEGEAVSLNSGQEIREFVEILAGDWQQRMLLPGQPREKLGSQEAHAQGSESFSSIDSAAVSTALKLLIDSGYSITRTSFSTCGTESKATDGVKGEFDALRKLLEGPTSADPIGLMAFWNRRDPAIWSHSSALYMEFGEGVLRTGEPLFAYDVVTEGLRYFPDTFALKRLWGFTLARSGALDLANRALAQLYEESPSDEETIGMLASTYKDMASEANDDEKKQLYLQRSFELYTKNYESNAGYWSGINAATVATLLGKHEVAQKIAKQVSDACREKLSHSETMENQEYWVLATLGEASLILGNWSEAEEWYSVASKHAGTKYADLITTRRNARLLLAAQNAEPLRFERCFHIPSVVVFVGHMIDRADRTIPRFPGRLADSISVEIEKRLEKLDARFGYSSAACGSDILFLETMLKRGGEIHIVLPYERDQFIQDSIDIDPAGNWRRRFEQVLDHATEVVRVSPHRLTGGSILYEYANRMIYGLAGLRSKLLETNLKALAVWDGLAGDGLGGAADTVDFWRKAGQEIEVIDPSNVLTASNPGMSIPQAKPPLDDPIRSLPESKSEFTPAIRSILFADAVGFSRLSEDEVLLFVRHYLGLVRQVIDHQQLPPLIKNTWGDGLYAVFSDARAAGVFALQLLDRINSAPWKELGLQDLDLRIGLHSGVLYSCIDPVTQQNNYIGSHVSRAAHIEPITPPGQIYASQAFAAQAWTESVTEFRCDYVGLTQMAKNYGSFPTFVVRHPRTD